MTWSNSAVDRITVSAPDKEALLRDIADRFATRHGFTLATINLDHVVKLGKNDAFHAAYAAQTHVTADGNPIVWLSRVAGQDVDLIPGSELIDPVAALAAQENVPVALFGATDASLRAAADGLKARYPTLDVVLTLAPPMGFDPAGPAADEAIGALRESGARMVFLALGAPKQEIFAARAFEQLPETGFLSIGAGLDFISGAQKRAPKWVRALAGEWLWRLLGNPTRLAARYGACIAILPGLLINALKARKQKRKMVT